MFYALIFLAISILAVSGYIKQTLGAGRAVTSLIGMLIVAGLIYVMTMRLTEGNELVTSLYLFLAPACGLIFKFMVGHGRR